MSLSLKDLLLHDSASCSSSGFKSFPRKPCTTSSCMEKQNETNAIHKTSNLYKIKTLQTLIKAFKNFHFVTMKPPSGLPRSFSRRLLSRRSSCKKQKELNVTVRVRDILRWKSSGDLIHEKSTPLDFDDSLHGEKCLILSPCVGRDSIEGTKQNVGPKEELSCMDEELNSPISVLDFQSDNEEQVTSFERNLADMERTTHKVMQKMIRLENLPNMDPFNLDDSEDAQEENADIQNLTEEKARQLLNCVKETLTLDTPKGMCMDQLLLDYFKEELKGQTYQSENYEDDEKMVLVAEALMHGQENWTFERMEAHAIRDIEGGGWSKLNVEKEELALEVESMILYYLVDDVLLDILSC